MSLVFLKNEDNANRGALAQEPFRFSNYLTNPLKIPKNSQVALVNASFNLTEEVILDNELPIYVLNGNLALNESLEMKLLDNDYVDNWTEFFNELGTDIVSCYSDNSIMWSDIDNNIVQPPQNNVPPLNPESRVQFETPVGAGLNWYLQNSKKSGLRLTQISDGINDSYFQMFSPIRRPATQADWNFTTSPTYTVTTPLNNEDFPNGGVDKQIGGTSNNWVQGSCTTNGSLTDWSPPLENRLGDQKSTTNEWNHLENADNFYNTHMIFNDGYKNDELFSGTTIDNIGPGGPEGPTEDVRRYWEKYNNFIPIPTDKRWGMACSTCGVLRSVGTLTPSVNVNGIGDGHQFIGSKRSGGYILVGCEGRQFADCENIYSQGFMGSANLRGNCGIAPKFFGLLPTACYLDRRNTEGSTMEIRESLNQYCDEVDLNAGFTGEAENQQSEGQYSYNTKGAKARYVIGVRMVVDATESWKTGFQAEMLVPDTQGGQLGQSKYMNIGRVLKIDQLGQGRNTADPNNFQFEPNWAINANPGERSINCVGQFGAQAQPKIYFRFRYETPYCIVIEFCLSDLVNHPNSYNPELDEPYLPYDDPAFSAQPNGYNPDPLRGWCLLGRMKNPLDPLTNTYSKAEYMIPAYMGDLGLVDYEIYSKSFCATKGFWHNKPVGKSRMNQDNSAMNFSLAGFREREFFKSEQGFLEGFYGMSIKVLDETDPTNPQTNSPIFTRVGIDLQDINLEGFDADGRIRKPFRMLMLSATENDTFEWCLADGTYRFIEGEPLSLNHGVTWGLQEYGNSVDRTITFDAEGNPGTPYEIQFYDGINPFINGDGIYSNHIQLINLPIQSANGVRSTMNKTIYVVPVFADETHKNQAGEEVYQSFTFTVPQIIWIDLNNYEEMELNKIDVLITNDDNEEQKALAGNTDITIMFRQKGSGDIGYLPINIGNEEPAIRKKVKSETIGNLVETLY